MTTPNPPPLPKTRSSFTPRQITQLSTALSSSSSSSASTANPLRVVAHIDMDAFYAQCEMKRLGVGRDVPLAVRQWNGLIAVNYAAREFGITRHSTVAEARTRCPELIAQHVATWREGDTSWAYHADAPQHMDRHKVALDPYRIESRQIMALIKDVLPATAASFSSLPLPPSTPLQRVEKASVDEAFFDLSAHVYAILVTAFGEARDCFGDVLPLPPRDALECVAALPRAAIGVKYPDDDDPLADANEEIIASTDNIPTNDVLDWDDVCIAIGARIAHAVRASILIRLGYMTSAGIASNKMLSKLASAHRKPAAQTVVPPRAVGNFLATKKISQIRTLGGKRGAQVTALVGGQDALVGDLLSVPLDRLRSRLGDEAGTAVYNMARGVDTSEVSRRTALKSMLSAKAFGRGRPLRDETAACSWLRVFCADIYARLVDEDAIGGTTSRRPRTLNLHFRHGDGGGGPSRSRSCPIPQNKAVAEDTLLMLARQLLQHLVAEAGAGVWPCEHLSLSVSGFEDAGGGSMGIGNFLVRGDKALEGRAVEEREVGQEPKRRKIEENPRGIEKFFKKGESLELLPIKDAEGEERYVCHYCAESLGPRDDIGSHLDWHVAVDLDRAERSSMASTAGGASAPSATGGSSALKGKGKGKRGRVEKGQATLRFG